MFPPTAVAEEILGAATSALRQGDRALLSAIDDVPIAIYAIDCDGFLTYYNAQCIAFAGRTPTLGRDRWGVCWKIYTEDGVLVPPERRPIARVLQDRAAIRGIRAVVERPNGSRAISASFPTPVLGNDGALLGAVNMVIDLSERQQAILDGFCSEKLERWYRAVIDRVLGTLSIDEMKALVGEIETELVRHAPRLLH